MKEIECGHNDIQIGGATLRMCTVRREVPFAIDVKGGEKYSYYKEYHTKRGSEGQSVTRKISLWLGENHNRRNDTHKSNLISSMLYK